MFCVRDRAFVWSRWIARALHSSASRDGNELDLEPLQVQGVALAHKCPECARVFGDLGAMRSHRASEHGARLRPPSQETRGGWASRWSVPNVHA